MKKGSDFVVIQDWMLDMNLSASEMIAYALIWMVCKDGRSRCRATAQYIGRWCKIRERQANSVLQSLVRKGLIEKSIVATNTGRCSEYHISAEGGSCNNCRTPIVQKLQDPSSNNCTTHRAKTAGPTPFIADNTITNNSSNTNTADKAREDWRFISSVQRSFLGGNPDKIVEHKRRIFRSEVEALAVEAGMPQSEVEAFVGWWTESTPGTEKIRAEFETVFNTLSRMNNWMERRRRKPAHPAQKSRIDQYEENMKFINDFFDGKQSSTAAPDEQ